MSFCPRPFTTTLYVVRVERHNFGAEWMHGAGTRSVGERPEQHDRVHLQRQ